MKPTFTRRIKSFVKRTGRMTGRQQHAYDTLKDDYCLNISDGMQLPEAVFEKAGPLILEIGFGMGHSLSAQAQANPDTHFIGIEVHTPGVGALLHDILSHALTNIRIYEADAIEVLKTCIPAGSVDTVQIFFPDPWPKTRHHKRRIIQPALLDLLVPLLKLGGVVHMATDWAPYADHMLAVFKADARFENCAPDGAFMPDTNRGETKFELRGKKLGHAIFDLQFKRCV